MFVESEENSLESFVRHAGDAAAQKFNRSVSITAH